MKKTKAKRKTAKAKAKRRARFVVGYTSANNCVYGEGEHMSILYVDPLTRTEAEKRVKQLFDGNATIYELVPVKD